MSLGNGDAFARISPEVLANFRARTRRAARTSKLMGYLHSLKRRPDDGFERPHKPLKLSLQQGQPVDVAGPASASTPKFLESPPIKLENKRTHLHLKIGP